MERTRQKLSAVVWDVLVKTNASSAIHGERNR